MSSDFNCNFGFVVEEIFELRHTIKSRCFDTSYSDSGDNSQRIIQEYPTEPLDKIPALQGRNALAGKLNIGHTHLLENLYECYAGWEFMLQRWF